MNKAITVNEIRSKFLKYMESKGHAIIPSSPLTPENDPTTLFTGSGMQPMLPYLLGQPHPLGTRIADSQKCFRSQDIEEVGDNRHTTFFEMLGNWSFGDYFKEEQIKWMWEFMIGEIGIDAKNVYISCFEGAEQYKVPKDSLSAETWKSLFESIGIEAKINERPEQDGMNKGDKIFYYSIKKNTWSRGGNLATAPINDPCGPDSEMFYDFDPNLENNYHAKSTYKNDKCHPNCDCGRFMEIGNNVFMEYVRRTENVFEKLPSPNVDHGSGLERWVAAINNDADMFNIDVFAKAKHVLSNINNQVPEYISDVAVTYTDLKDPTFAYRVVLDHARAATFLIGDGVLPGNKDQMYFVRRLIRRAVRYARNLNINTNFMADVAVTFIDYYKDEYTNLLEKKELILSEIDKEESKFRKTLESGLKEFERISRRDHFELKDKNFKTENKRIFGHEAFDLLQSHGFPIELTQELAKERGWEVDIEDFNKLKNEHAEASRTASAGKFKGGLGGDGVMEVKYHTATHLLHEALRKVLGESVTQKGSNITSERLRFDFAFERKVTDEEKKKVEDIVNEVINQALPVTREEISYNEARARGAIGLFGDKYGEKVSVYTVGKETGKRGEANLFSLEFCGGPHVNNTSELGIFKIQKEEAVSAGVRRIKGVLV